MLARSSSLGTLLFIAVAVVAMACGSPSGESARVSPQQTPEVTVAALYAVLLEELPAEAARNMSRGEPAEAVTKGMSGLVEIAGSARDWNGAVARVRGLVKWLVLDLTVVEARVTRVIDGDTIDVMFTDGSGATVRYADMDAPEVGEACSREATAFNRAMVEGKLVTLKWPFDPENRLDRYGRIVRDVWVYYPPAKGEMWVNWYLVREGFAQQWGEALHANGELRPMTSAEISAMLAGRGCLWRS